LILESANFEGARIHLTSRELGLVTDASFRFEHQLDPALTTYALDLLAQLIQELAGGEILKGEIDEKLALFKNSDSTQVSRNSSVFRLDSSKDRGSQKT